MKILGKFYRNPSPLIKILRNISILDDHSNQPILNDTFKIFDDGHGYHTGVGFDKDGAIKDIFELPKEVDVQQLEDNQSISEAYIRWEKRDGMVVLEPGTEVALCCIETFEATVIIEKEAVYCSCYDGHIIEGDTLLFIEEGDMYFRSVDRYLKKYFSADEDEDERTRL